VEPGRLLNQRVSKTEFKVDKESDLKRWFKEKWVDISRKDKSGKHPECGRSDADKGAYPKCRPSKKVSKETPTVAKSLSKKEKKKAVSIKRRKEKSAPSESAGGGARKPKYTKLSEYENLNINKKADDEFFYSEDMLSVDSNIDAKYSSILTQLSNYLKSIGANKESLYIDLLKK
jgi:hypothetical protein